MKPSIAAYATLALVLFMGAASARAAEPYSGAPPLQHDHGAAAPPPAAPAATAAVRAPEAEIDRLLAAMNAAQGDAKVALMADLIVRLVAERRSASTEAGACPMCAAKMAGKAAGMAAGMLPGTSPEQPSAHEHKNDATPPRPGCAMMANK